MTYIKVPASLFNQIVKYIVSKPHQEVDGLVKLIEKHARAEEDLDEETKETKEA